MKNERILQTLKREHPSSIPASTGWPVAMKSIIKVEQEDHTHKEFCQQVHSSIRNAPKSRSVQSRPGAKSGVQPTQRNVEGHDPQHGERGVLRNAWDLYKNSGPSVFDILDDRDLVLYMRSLLVSHKDNTKIELGSIWYIIVSTIRDEEGSNSRRASWEHWETTNLSRSSHCGS